MNRNWVLPILVIVTAACGDPRLNFAGTWKGAAKTIVRFSDGSSETYPHGEAIVVITAPERSNLLTFNGKCAMSATVNDDRTFTLNKKACPVERVSFPSGTSTISCDLVETVNGGTGTLSTSSLSMSYFGDSQLTHCTDGLNGLATYTSEFTLSQQ